MAPLSSSTTLPEAVRRCFWDVAPNALSWPDSREFIVGRVLSAGQWDAVQWLLGRVSLAEVASWLRRHRGGDLPPQRLRYWQLILNLPPAEVDDWIARTRAGRWPARMRR